MTRWGCILAAGLSVWGFGASAQTLDCDNAQTQMEMTACAEQDWQAADAELNEAYEAAAAFMAGIDADLAEDEPGAATYLRDAQRDWIRFRDNACAAEGYVFHGGSAEPMVIYACRARLTTARTDDLRKLVEENAMTGGTP